MAVSDPDSDDDDREFPDDPQKTLSSESDDEDLSSLPRIQQQPEVSDTMSAPSVEKTAVAEDMDVSSTDGRLS